MIQQSSYLNHPIHRFELKINGDENAYERAFNLYGILLMRALFGGVLIYNILELRQVYFTITFSLMIVILTNIYFYYERTTYTSNSLKLIPITWPDSIDR